MTGKINLLNEHGDTAVTWDTDKPTSVEEARRVFEGKLAEGSAAYEIKGDGTREVVRDFPEEATQVVIIPALQGG